MDPDTVRLFRQCVLNFIAQRELLRGVMSQHADAFCRRAYSAMPPVAPCTEMVLRAKASAAAASATRR